MLDNDNIGQDLAIGHTRFPFSRALRVADELLCKNILITSPFVSSRREHIKSILAQQTTRGGGWIYITDGNDRESVRQLKQLADAADRSSDFQIIDLEVGHTPGGAGQPNQLSCIVLPPLNRVEQKHAEPIAHVLKEICTKINMCAQMPGRWRYPAYIVAMPNFPDLVDATTLAAGETALEVSSPMLTRLITAVTQSRSMNCGFIMGSHQWPSDNAYRRYTEQIRHNALTDIIHPGAVFGHCEERLEQKIRNLRGERFLLVRQATGDMRLARMPRKLAPAVVAA